MLPASTGEKRRGGNWGTGTWGEEGKTKKERKGRERKGYTSAYSVLKKGSNLVHYYHTNILYFVKYDISSFVSSFLSSFFLSFFLSVLHSFFLLSSFYYWDTVGLTYVLQLVGVVPQNLRPLYCLIPRILISEQRCERIDNYQLHGCWLGNELSYLGGQDVPHR